MKLHPPRHVPANPGPPGFARFGALNFARSGQLLGLTSQAALQGVREKTFLQESFPAGLLPRARLLRTFLQESFALGTGNAGTDCGRQASTGGIAMPSRQ
jgi:hypothetical protein